MKKASKIIWILNAFLGCIAVLLVAGYGILNNNQNNGNINNQNQEILQTEPPVESVQVNANENADGEKAVSTPEPEEIKQASLVFTGDIMLKDYHIEKYDKAGITSIISKSLMDRLKEADITMINEEFPFSLRGTPMEDKQYTFRVDPKYSKVFQELGVDIVTLANNHTLDYGTDALLDSFTTLDEAGIKYAGAGENLERAKEVQYIEKNGYTFGFVAASRVIPVTEWNATSSKAGLLTTYDATAACEQIKEAKKNADYVIIYVHWGIEYSKMPEDYQRTMAKAYIDAGADVVIGSHTHCLQGIEYYNGCPIVYSLGNFIFSQKIEQTAYVKVDVNETDGLTLSIYPCKADDCKTELVTKKQEIKEFNEYIESISYGIEITNEQKVVSKEKD